MTTTITGVQIAGIRRGINTPSGNARYVLTLTDGRDLRTMDDAAVNHKIENEEYREALVDLTMRDGRVVDVVRS